MAQQEQEQWCSARGSRDNEAELLPDITLEYKKLIKHQKMPPDGSRVDLSRHV